MMSGAELGFRSELIFHRADGEVVDLRVEHGCRLIRTPSNPSFFWGNYLLFDRAPRAGDARRWEGLFERLIADAQPESTHRTFGWIEDAAGEIDDFLAAGYRRNDTVVMQTTQLPDVPAPTLAAALRSFALRGAAAEREWAQLLELHVATRGPEFDAEAYRPFARRSVGRWRALAEAGQGGWFGAFVGDGGQTRLAAALGLCAEREPEHGERIARFQAVMTDERFRRRGLCRALIATAMREVRSALAADRFVIVAAAGEMPEQLYASVGFVTAGRQRGVQLNRVSPG
jgi:ribosomal protein S18 acetylase RimI-like enzyme